MRMGSTEFQPGPVQLPAKRSPQQQPSEAGTLLREPSFGEPGKGLTESLALLAQTLPGAEGARYAELLDANAGGGDEAQSSLFPASLVSSHGSLNQPHKATPNKIRDCLEGHCSRLFTVLSAQGQSGMVWYSIVG